MTGHSCDINVSTCRSFSTSPPAATMGAIGRRRSRTDPQQRPGTAISPWSRRSRRVRRRETPHQGDDPSERRKCRGVAAHAQDSVERNPAATSRMSNDLPPHPGPRRLPARRTSSLGLGSSWPAIISPRAIGPAPIHIVEQCLRIPIRLRTTSLANAEVHDL